MRITSRTSAGKVCAAVFAAYLLVPAPAIAIAEDINIAQSLGSGMASWYGPEMAGKRTASGEQFDPDDYTAAHRDLPFGTKVLVTYARTGRSVIVRVNDRGPWGRGRIIDVSEAAADEIGLKRDGHGRVELRLLSDDGEASTSADAASS